MVFGMGSSYSTFNPKLHLRPAFTMKAHLQAPYCIGHLNTGPLLEYVNINDSRTFKFESVEGYSPQIRSIETVFGGDLLSMDPDRKHARGDIRGVIKTGDGDHIALSFKSIIKISKQIEAIMIGEASAMTTSWEDYITVCEFKLTNQAPEKYNELQNKTFVAAGRFTVDSEGVGFEYRISEVVAEP